MSEIERIRPFYPLIKSLYKASRNKLGFEPHPTIYVSNNLGNAKNPLGKTAHYSPSEHKIVLYTTGRHIKDILRSLSHELVHHNQNCNGKFDGGAATVVGYAQEDPHLRDMEREAYEVGNMIFRDWEDSLKKKGGKSLFTTKSNYVRPMMTNVIGGRLVEGDKQMKLTESRLREMIRNTIREMIDESLNEEEMMEAEMKEEEMEEAKEMICEPHCMEEDVMEEDQNSDDAQMEKDNAEAAAAGEGAAPKINLEEEVVEEEQELNESWLPKGRDIRSSAREMTYDALLKKWAK